MEKFLAPFVDDFVITQSFEEHIQRAKSQGWCYKPGGNCAVYYYPGIDYGTPLDTPLICSADTIRAEIQNQGTKGYGKNIRLTLADGYYLIYAHLNKFNIRTGDKPKAGDIIGWSGNTGYSTGAHLHYELRLNGVPIDPTPFLSGEMGLKIPEFPFMCVPTKRQTLRLKPYVEEQYAIGSLPKSPVVVRDTHDDGTYLWFQTDAWFAAQKGTIPWVEIQKG